MATKSNVIILCDYIRTNTKGGVKHIANFLDYIATREGTDLSLSFQEVQRETENQLLINSDLEKSKNDQHILNHIDYMGNREGVVKDGEEKDHGLFDARGVPDICAVRDEVRSLRKTPVYRFIVSLREETAINLEFTDKDSWSRMARNSMPFVAEQMNIPLENFNWVCAYHIKDGHPHIHIAAWDKTDKSRPRGWEQIPEKNFTKIRSIIVTEVNRERKIELTLVKDEMRKYITTNLKDDTKAIVEFMQYGKRPTVNKLDKNSVMTVSDRKILGYHIKEISKVLPRNGRTAYKYLKPEVKAVVDKAIEDTLLIDKFKGQYEQYISSQREIISMYRSDEEGIQEKVQEAAAEFKKVRVSNIIIKQSKDYLMYTENVRNKKIDNEIDRAISSPKEGKDINYKNIKGCSNDLQKEIKKHNTAIKESIAKTNKVEEVIVLQTKIVSSLPVPDDETITSNILEKEFINEIAYTHQEKQTLHNICRQRVNSLENILTNCKQDADQEEVKKLMYMYRKYSLLTGHNSYTTLAKMVEINQNLNKPLPLNELVTATNHAEVNSWAKNVQLKNAKGFVKTLNITDKEIDMYSPALKNEQDIAYNAGNDDMQKIKDKAKDEQKSKSANMQQSLALAGFGSRLFREMTNLLENNQPAQSPANVLDKLRGKKQKQAEQARNR